MRRAQQQMQKSLPYARKICQVIGHLAHGHPEYKHPFMLRREVSRVGYIVVSTDRGFCGGLNINLFKNVFLHMKQWQAKKIPVEVCVIGRKAESYFRRAGCNIVAHADQIGERPQLQDLIGSIKVMLDHYSEGKLDSLYLCHNEFVNTMKQDPIVQQILPLQELEDMTKSTLPWDYLYEPDPKELLDTLLIRFIESQIYQAVVDNVAAEQAARRVAMKSATDNAGNLIQELLLIYNKARQSAITTELTEIVAGADAV
jgi:F-type H+-transporting ATPase subunit gamma